MTAFVAVIPMFYDAVTLVLLLVLALASLGLVALAQALMEG